MVYSLLRRSLCDRMAVDRTSRAYPPLPLSLESIETIQSFLRTVILCLIAGAAVASREFAVVRFESIIHE